MSTCIALGAYTTTMFALMAIYSKTALGMGLQAEFYQFFDACAPFRLLGFQSFSLTIVLYNASWVLCLLLNYEGPLRWVMAAPAFVVGVTGLYHYNMIINLAATFVYS